jgi:hypothetical protein
MSEFHDTELEQSATGLDDRGTATSGKGTQNQLVRMLFGGRKKNLARTLTLVVVGLGIAAVIGHVLSKPARLLTQLPIFVGTPSRSVNTRSAVLAVDTFGFTVRAQNAAASTLKLFEQAVVEQLAGLHQTYSEWADKNSELMGSLVLKLTVDAKGAVVRVEPMTSQLTNSTFTKTVLADVREWKFPKGKVEAAEITVPLLFVPKGMDPDTVVHWERKVRGNHVDTMAAANENVAAHPRIATVGEPMPHTKMTNAPIRHSQKPKPQEEVRVAFKTNRPVTIRENPRFSAKNVHEADGDTQLSIIETRGDWLKVKLADAGFVGFVRKEFVSPIN